MDSTSWYNQLHKPSWAPPVSLFGPVWTFLYAVIAVSFGTVFYKVFLGKVPAIVALPFVLNLVFNILFTPLQFGLRNNLLASIDSALIFGTLIWAMVAIYSHIPWVTYAQIPYLLWVGFATILQISITWLNK